MKFSSKDAPPAYSGDRPESSSRNAALPSYAASTAIPPSINRTTLLPATFKVGKLKTEPFVTVPELKLHLRLLAAFDALQQQVRATPETQGAVLDGDTRWSVFCTRAEKKYEQWVQELFLAEGEVEEVLERGGLPGLDVLMAWHAHMLNPRKYYEDTKRDPRFERLAQVGAFPLKLITRCIDPVTFAHSPKQEKAFSASRVASFPTDPGSIFALACPQCLAENNIPWLTHPDQPHGYCQKDFQHTCQCGLVITHDVLRVARICRDIIDVTDGSVVFLAGLGLMPSTGDLTHMVGPRVSSAIAELLKNAVEEWTPSDLGRFVFHWKFSEVEAKLDAMLNDGSLERTTPHVSYKFSNIRLRFGRMYAAYAHDGMAGLSLGPAVMRQANFIGQMARMGWLRPGIWEGGIEAVFLLQKTAARYHAFLDLMTAAPQVPLCPTLDIDLAWHTHQLQGPQYRDDSLKITLPLSRFIDHDDKVAEVALGDAYDRTSRAWLATFKVPYSQCGCHQGDLADIDGGTSQAIQGKLKFWNKGKADQLRREMGEAISAMDQSERDSSHPSVHNLVTVQTTANEEKRKQRLDQVNQLNHKAVTLKASTKDRNLGLKRALTRDPAHPDPFVQIPPTLDASDNAPAYEPPAASSSLPYWGVGIGSKPVVGGLAAWGLALQDPHVLHADDCEKRGSCAAGAGGGVNGTGYCASTGPGTCVNYNPKTGAGLGYGALYASGQCMTGLPVSGFGS